MSDTGRVVLRVWGEWALFTRPEFGAERISYDVITPSAACGILEQIWWKPAMRWVIERIHVLAPIRTASVRRNEVGCKLPPGRVRAAMEAGTTEGVAIVVEDERQQRASLMLRDVDYVIEARAALSRHAGRGETIAKHAGAFRRRAQRGQCIAQPYLGTRECTAWFEPVGTLPRSALAASERDRNLGWMLHGIDYGPADRRARWFDARMRGGVIEVPETGR